jgi:hypothetical protein
MFFAIKTTIVSAYKTTLCYLKATAKIHRYLSASFKHNLFIKTKSVLT